MTGAEVIEGSSLAKTFWNSINVKESPCGVAYDWPHEVATTRRKAVKRIVPDE